MMFGPREREILTQALCRLHRLRPTPTDQPPCKLGTACVNREACENMTQRTLDFMRDLGARPRAVMAPFQASA